MIETPGHERSHTEHELFIFTVYSPGLLCSDVCFRMCVSDQKINLDNMLLPRNLF